MRIIRTDAARCDWASMDSSTDRQVFQSREWLEFVVATQGGEIVVATVEDGGTAVGWFSGIAVRRFGARILGSPFPGWSTPYLGFNLAEGVSRRAAWEALTPFAFQELGCMHLEVRDRYTTADMLDGLGFDPQRPLRVFEIDLGRTEQEILAGMDANRRRGIRQAAKNGIVIEEAHDLGFADDFHAQLVDVFDKQSLVPTYGVERVRELIRRLQPTGHLLLLRARDRSGDCVATGIFPAMSGTMHFWGGASWRQAQALHPNEPLMWYAMRWWKDRGMTTFDMGGAGDYKRRYGPTERLVPTFSRSRWRTLLRMRNLMEAGAGHRQRLAGRRSRRRARPRIELPL